MTSTIAHNILRGVNLHEIKGAAAAADDNVATATSNATVYRFASPANTDGSLEPFRNALLHLRYQVSNGTNGGDIVQTTNTFYTRPLNTTVVNGISGASLTSNQITLPAGTYIVRGSSTIKSALVSWNRQIRLRNMTTSETLVVQNAGMSSEDSMGVSIAGKFTLSGSATVELQHWVKQNTPSTITNGWGAAISSGEVEVYADLMLWKIP